MNTLFDPTPEELLEAEESAQLIDDVLAERNIDTHTGLDLHTAHLLRTLNPDTTTPRAAFLAKMHAEAKALFPRKASLFYRMRFALIGVPLLGSMGIAALAFLYAMPEDQPSSIARTTQNTNVGTNENSTHALTGNANENVSIENSNTSSTLNENSNAETNSNGVTTNANVNGTTRTNTSTTPSLDIDGITADLAVLSSLEADITTSVDDIGGLLADSLALSSTDTVSADIDALSTELSTL